MKRILMIDDEKESRWITRSEYYGDLLKDCEIVIAKTFDTGIELLKKEGEWSMLLLDHDLGFDGKTGYDIICFLEENTNLCPKEIMLITFNPSGGARILQVINKLEEKGITKYIGWWKG